MLPRVLSAQLCSLLGNIIDVKMIDHNLELELESELYLGSVERYAVSVIWEIHPQTFKV